MRLSYQHKVQIRKRQYPGMKTFEGVVVILENNKTIRKSSTGIESLTIDSALSDGQRLAKAFDRFPASNCLSPVERALEAANIYNNGVTA